MRNLPLTLILYMLANVKLTWKKNVTRCRCHFMNTVTIFCVYLWDELARLRGLAWLGEMIFIPSSYGIFYLTAKSLLRHCKKIFLITWLLSRKFYIFNMDFRRLQQFHFTVYSIMNMITAFSILLQLHGILLILVLLILNFTYQVVLAVAILKSNLERILKIRMRFEEKSIPPCRAGSPAYVHMTNFHHT